MKNEEKQLLLKDLCARLPYGVKAQVQGWDEEKQEEVNVALKVYSVNTDGYVYFESNDYDVRYYEAEACLLYLRPMSSMTEEERKEWQARALMHPKTVFADKLDSLIDWLNAHHFDYRGLIPMGLALEAPEDMYKID